MVTTAQASNGGFGYNLAAMTSNAAELQTETPILDLTSALSTPSEELTDNIEQLRAELERELQSRYDEIEQMLSEIESPQARMTLSGIAQGALGGAAAAIATADRSSIGMARQAISAAAEAARTAVEVGRNEDKKVSMEHMHEEVVSHSEHFLQSLADIDNQRDSIAEQMADDIATVHGADAAAQFEHDYAEQQRYLNSLGLSEFEYQQRMNDFMRSQAEHNFEPGSPMHTKYLGDNGLVTGLEEQLAEALARYEEAKGQQYDAIAAKNPAQLGGMSREEWVAAQVDMLERRTEGQSVEAQIEYLETNSQSATNEIRSNSATPEDETPNQLPGSPFNNTTASLDLDMAFDPNQYSPAVIEQANAAVAGLTSTSLPTGGDDTQDVDIATTAVTSAQLEPEGRSV